MIAFDKGTWLDEESLAYNTANGGHWHSNRRAKAVCSDGKLRTVVCGIPDTYFSIPGHCKIDGKTVTGHLYISENVVSFVQS